MLNAHHLRASFANQPPILDDVSLSLAPGEWVGLNGDSGAGKSTLGKLLAGHLMPQAGYVEVDGAALPARGLRPVQWLPQSPELTVTPRWRVKRILEEAWTPPDALREAFGIEPGWLNRYPQALSGGELQRVNVLRALVPGVRYLVADEISSMLDPLTQLALWQALRQVAEARGLGVLVISHDEALLKRLCTRRLRLSEGRLHGAQSATAKAPQATSR
ncbi:ABC transporter ATP-binding protein [Halomonas sp. HL-93]|uniref:ABC transporter ATP-binding protein n=1 Tax=Halomonas sp. HL-93 TaxID=1666906 RepID=UPI0006DB2436|nr:ATP-binding cassette domain-containing protein [Halomonas sp. HL-93]KPQ21444.1 MAG: ABC-type nickel uptake system ATPase component NikE [Halomonas sp. HL-93]SBR50135.1 peptide/nickel transport system ATP-binding protein [Halomonas sp. HL-93]